MRTTTTATLFYSSQMITPRNPAASNEASTRSSTVQLSPWHSPVPYLFGGLAATMGLIAFALLLLACSYWKRPGEGNEGDNGDESDVEGGAAATEKCRNGSGAEATAAFEEKFLVIMAGDVKPTFLATPTSINHDKSRNENQTEIKSQENHQESSSSSSSSSHEQNEI